MEQNFVRENNNYYRLMVKLFRLEYLAAPFSEMLGVITLIIILAYGGTLVLNSGTALSGEIFIFYLVVFSQLIPPAKTFSEAFFKIQKGVASLERINHILHSDDRIRNVANVNSQLMKIRLPR